MSDDSSRRHHEVPRMECCVPTGEISHTPMKYVHVMSQTRTSFNCAAEHTFNDYWNAEIDASLLKESIGTERFQILRTKPPQGYKCVNGRPTIIKETTKGTNCKRGWQKT